MLIADEDTLSAFPYAVSYGVSAQCTIDRRVCQRPSPNWRATAKHSPPLREIWVVNLTMALVSWILRKRAARGPPSNFLALLLHISAIPLSETTSLNDQPGSNAQKGRFTDATSARLYS